MHARPHVAVEPWFAIPGAKDNVKDHLTERLGHGPMMTERVPEVNRAFSAEVLLIHSPGALPQVRHGESVLWRTDLTRAPLALNTN
jgi:hypothetical protein